MRSASLILLASALTSAPALAARLPWSNSVPAPQPDSQRVFASSEASYSSSPSREPDFVDILNAEAREKLLAEAKEEDTVLNILPIGLVAPPAQSKAWNAGPPGSGWAWSDCGLPDDAVSVQSIEVSPDPPVPGQNMTVTARGTVKEEIRDGSFADVVVKIGLIKLLTRRFDVCEEARKNNAELQCPVQPGEYEVTQTVALPREIPPAKFNVHIGGSTQDDVNLLCLDLSINFMRH